MPNLSLSIPVVLQILKLFSKSFNLLKPLTAKIDFDFLNINNFFSSFISKFKNRNINIKQNHQIIHLLFSGLS